MGNSLVVQWLELCSSTVGGSGLIPNQRTKILPAKWHDWKQKRRGKEGKVEERHVSLNLSDRKKYFGKTQNWRREDIRSTLRNLFIAQGASEIFRFLFRYKVLTSCGPNRNTGHINETAWCQKKKNIISHYPKIVTIV